jgi:D-arabinose 1-dehydrogenase-like Zn-dependent alcohol dehydrogenase
MSKSVVVEVRTRGGALELAERPVPEPAEDQVRIKVEACGICRGDDVCRMGFWPGIEYPRIPGHEVIGIVDAVGSGVEGIEIGERVGTGWNAGYCENCYACRRGDFAGCKNANINGIFNDGGYAQFMTVAEHAIVRIPQDCDWTSAEIAPLLCAGVSTFNPLRNSGVRAGELVAVQGIGGLGHLAVQFAQRMGYRVAAISSGADKQDLAHELGAHIYIDGSQIDPAEALRKLGGASLILSTAPNAAAIGALVEGLRMNGKMIVVAAPHEKVAINTLHLLGNRAGIMGWPGGTPADSEDTIAFSLMTNVKPMVEVFPLKDANIAYERMQSNKVRFRAVLDCRS